MWVNVSAEKRWQLKKGVMSLLYRFYFTGSYFTLIQHLELNFQAYQSIIFHHLFQTTLKIYYDRAYSSFFSELWNSCWFVLYFSSSKTDGNDCTKSDNISWKVTWITRTKFPVCQYCWDWSQRWRRLIILKLIKM